MNPLEKQTLFWDVDLNDLDEKAHAKFIIERILDWGDVEDARWLFGRYSAEQIRSVITSSRALSERSENFWRLYFNLPPCTPKSSHRTHSPFSLR